MWRIKLDQNRWPTVDRTVAYLPTPKVTHTNTRTIYKQKLCVMLQPNSPSDMRERLCGRCVLLRRWMFSTLRAERRRGQVFHVSALKKSPNPNTGSREIKGLHLCCKRAQVVSEDVTAGEAERAWVQRAVLMTLPASSTKVTLGRRQELLRWRSWTAFQSPAHRLATRWRDGRCDARFHCKIIAHVAQLY